MWRVFLCLSALKCEGNWMGKRWTSGAATCRKYKIFPSAIRPSGSIQFESLN
jgi:hypothetical protein